MKDWTRKTGRRFVHRTTDVAIKIGADEWTRYELYTLFKDPKRCVGNFNAARNLERALKNFKPKGLKELARRINFDDIYNLDGVADTGRFVWCSLLESKGIDVIAWLDKEPTRVRAVQAKGRRKGHPHLRLVKSA